MTLWVHAGIAAADVICRVRLGRDQSGQDHRGAKALLRTADQGSEVPLGRLLNLRTPVGYSYKLVGAEDRLAAKRAAESRVERAAEVFQ